MSKNSFKISKSLVLKPGQAPAVPQNGEIYYDESTNKIAIYQNGSWITVADNGELSSEISARISADSSLDSKVSSEVSRAESAEGSLADAISSEASMAIAAELSLASQISTSASSEASARTSADSSLADAISSESSSRVAGDGSLDAKISAEQSARFSSDSLLNSNISTEEASRISADSSLDSKISAESSKITSEISDRISSDSSLDSKISSEVSTRQSADSSLTARISIEENARASADASLDSKLSSETSSRQSADSSLDSKLSNETSSRQSADSSLTTRLSSEENTRVSADSSLDSKISSETSSRQSADSSLDSKLSNETSSRQSADSSLTTRLSSEESARISADTSLENEILLKADKAILSDMKEPTGHVDRTQSTISFDESTRTLSISPTATSFSIYTAGVKQTISSTLTKQIPDTSGNYFFYINSSGALDYYTTFNPSLLTGVAYTAFVHWNATDNQAVTFGDERHGITMDGTTHGYLHTTRGTQLASGASITFDISGDGTSDSDAQIALTDMQVRDEDITVSITNSASPTLPFQQTLSPIAKIPVVYRVGSEWKRATATDFPMSQGTTRAQYNKNTSGTWSLEDASADGKYLVSYIFATTDVHQPVIALLGQGEFSDLDDAKANGTWDKISFGDLPAQEMKLIYLLFYETSSTYTNAPKAIMKAVSDVRWGADRQVSASVFNGDHANLSGLGNDDHVQYLLASGARAMAGHLNMGSNNITNVNTINGYVLSDISASVSSEASSRQSADSSLDSKFSSELSSEVSSRQSADSSLDSKISTEESVRTSADSSLTTRISTEESVRASADGSLESRLSTEESVRASADGSLESRLSTEESVRTSADSSLTTRISTEESSRSSADSSLTTRISTEESVRASADSSLTTRISTEESVRASADLILLPLDGSRSMSGSLNMNNNSVNNITQLVSSPRLVTATTNGSLSLNSTDKSIMYITGIATGYSVVLPNSTSILAGTYYEIYNSSSAAVTVKYNSGTTLFTVNANSVAKIILQQGGAQDGTWSVWSLETNIASGITNYNTTATTSFATSSNVDVAITDFVVTPQAGTYAIFFNSSNTSTSNNSLNYVSLYKAGVQIPGTERETQAVASNFRFQMSTLGIATFNGTEELRVYVRVTTGTLTVNARTGVALRLGG